MKNAGERSSGIRGTRDEREPKGRGGRGERRENTVFPYRTGDTLKRSRAVRACGCVEGDYVNLTRRGMKITGKER